MERQEKISKLAEIVRLGHEVEAVGNRLKRRHEVDELPGEHKLPGDWKAEVFEAIEKAGLAVQKIVLYFEKTDSEI